MTIIIDKNNPHILAASPRQEDAYGNPVRYIYDGELVTDNGVDISIQVGSVLFPAIRCGGNLIFDEPTEDESVVRISTDGNVDVSGSIKGGALIAGSVTCSSINADWITTGTIKCSGDIECRGDVEVERRENIECGGTMQISGEIVILEE